MDHPKWLDPGKTVLIVRSLGHSKMPPRTAKVARQTTTLVVLDTGERFTLSPFGRTYVLTPKYLDYSTILLKPDEED